MNNSTWKRGQEITLEVVLKKTSMLGVGSGDRYGGYSDQGNNISKDAET